MLGDGDASRARELLDAAPGLWRGEPLAALAHEPFAQREIAPLEEARLAALEERIEADQMLGHDRRQARDECRRPSPQGTLSVDLTVGMALAGMPHSGAFGRSAQY